MKKFIMFFFFAAIISAQVSNPIPEPKIEFNPRHYVCYKTDKPIKIDGNITKPAWSKAEWTDYFIDIEGNSKPVPRFKTRAKMLWDENYLYIAAEIEDPQVWATIKKRDAVIFHDNDFEIFIDTHGTTHKYYELEINAFATAWDLFLVKPYRDAGSAAINSWDIRGLKVAVKILGTINNPNDIDKGWTAEIAIPWSVLKESYVNDSTPKNGEQFRLNFSRVEWKTKVINGKYVKETDPKTNQPYPEDNWLWSPQGVINVHYPEMWGFVQFSTKIAGTGKDEFISYPKEKAKWALRKVYYAEHDYQLKYGSFTSDIKKLGLENYKVEGYTWPPEFEATKNLFMATITSTDGKEKISIKDDGEVR